MQIVTDSGCGEPVGGTVGPLSWSIEDGFTLSVTGEGNMPSYSSTEQSSKQPLSIIVSDSGRDTVVT